MVIRFRWKNEEFKMKVSIICLVYYLFCFAFHCSTCEDVTEPEACREAASVLEWVMFFPLEMCENSNNEELEKGSDWLSWLDEYTSKTDYLLQMVNLPITRIVNAASDLLSIQAMKSYFETATLKCREIATPFLSSLNMYWTSTNMENIKDICRLKLLMFLEMALPIQQQLMEAVSNGSYFIHRAAADTLSNLTTLTNINVPLITLFVGDISMSTKACLTSVWKECLNCVTSSPGLCLRYSLALLLGISLLFSVYFFVREIPNALHRRRRRRTNRSTTKRNNKQIQHLSFLNHIRFPKEIPRFNPDFSRNDSTGVLHYRMCEVYDGCSCNCGGKSSPIGGRIRTSLGIHGRRKKFTLTPSHYLMCEYFDALPCNCGGYLRKSPISDYSPIKMTPKLFYVLPDPPQTHCKQETLQKSDEQNIISQPEDTGIDIETSTQEQNPCVEMHELTKHEHNSTSMFTEVSTIEEIEDDSIGRPKFNSSFLEESPHAYISSLSDSAYSDRGMGDGPMLVITRRSPKKECGISFEEDDDDELLSYFDGTTSEDNESLLDVSDINKSLSFNNGDGVYEFVVLYTLQTIYRTAKRFFQRKESTSHELSRVSISEISKDRYFVLSQKETTNRKYKWARNRNRSAVEPSIKQSDASDICSPNDSLTDTDRVSDLSSYYGNKSREAVSGVFESWSLSTSKDDSSFLIKQKCDVNEELQNKKQEYESTVQLSPKAKETHMTDKEDGERKHIEPNYITPVMNAPVIFSEGGNTNASNSNNLKAFQDDECLSVGQGDFNTHELIKAETVNDTSNVDLQSTAENMPEEQFVQENLEADIYKSLLNSKKGETLSSECLNFEGMEQNIGSARIAEILIDELVYSALYRAEI